MNILPTLFTLAFFASLFLAARAAKDPSRAFGFSKNQWLLGCLLSFVLIGATAPDKPQATTKQPRATASSPADTAMDEAADAEEAPRSDFRQSVSSSGQPTSSRTLPFSECVAFIYASAASFGIDPITIVNTDIMKVVRLPAQGGSVLMTCSRPDQKLVIVQSDNEG